MRALAEERGALLARLGETERALAAARAGFDRTADRDLMEYYLYQISALRARHSYLLGRLKEEG